jgi:small-conductance mechanosensitive channel
MLEELRALWGDRFLGNPWERWIIAAGTLLLVFSLSWAVRRLLISRLKVFAQKTDTLLDDLLLLLLERTRLYFFFFLALYLGFRTLTLSAKAEHGAGIVFCLVLFLQIGFWASHALNFLGNSYAEKALSVDAARATTVRTMLMFGKMLVWIVVALLLLDNWGVKVAPFIAGLGVGGVAIALAVQNILSDLFASLSIVLDKPFVIGDFIAVGDEAGAVEHIGLKTTRVKSISGEQLVFSNSDLLKSRIRNYKRMWERRVVFSFGVVYETPPEKLDAIRQITERVVKSVEGTRFDRCHLTKFAGSSLDYETVYWVNSADYNYYIERHHRISVGLIKAFQAESIEFAYPTQVLHIDGTIEGNNARA